MLDEQRRFKALLDDFVSGNGRTIVLVANENDGEGAPWRVLTSDEARHLRTALEEASEGAPPAAPLCYNMASAAKAVGVSEHKIISWLRRAVNPLPHIQDVRRIIIPGDLLAQWLRDEAARQISKLIYL